MAGSTREAIGALRRSHDELVELVGKFGPEDLRRSSGSKDWTVAQVVSHLGSASEIGLQTLTSGKADFDAAQGVWGRWNAMSPDEQARNFVAAGERLVEALESLDDEALANKRIDMGFLPAPIDLRFFVGMRLSEVGLHRWDVDVSFDPEAQVVPYVVPFLLDILLAFAGHFAKPDGRTGRVAIDTNQPSRNYVLDLSEHGTTLREGADAEAQTRLTLPAEALLRLTSGRLGPDHTPASITVDGELSLDDLRRAFPGY
ncbi:MAG: maleylpyruvate isomerase family mycothiol-dependent enzyme [Acidimicrobiales bacterium]